MCLRQAKAVSIEGHPDADFNGLYTHDSTHEGWPVLKNANAMYCFRHAPHDTWLLNNEFAPDSDLAAAVVASQGPLPVGAHTWLVYDGEWVDVTLTVTLLPTEAAVEATEQRQKEALAEESVTRAAVARAQLETVREVIVAGCAEQGCNGSYAPRPAHDGWPRFENEHGMHLYYYARDRQWFLNDRFTPDVDGALLMGVSADGTLPDGQGEWYLTMPGDRTTFANRHTSFGISLR